VFNTTQALGLFAGGAAGGWLMQHYGATAVFVFGLALVALWLIVAAPMHVPERVVSRAFAMAAGAATADLDALRERLLRLRGVRDAVIMPERGVAMLTFYPDKLDENEVTKLLGGES
jgi:hypothetical protein